MAGESLSSGAGAISNKDKKDYNLIPYNERYTDKVVTDRSTLSRLPGGYQYYRVTEPPADPKPVPVTDGGNVSYIDSSKVKYNLPPHEWSLPLERGKTSTQAYRDTTVDHAQRRALMWFYGGADTTTGAGLINPAGSTESQTTGQVYNSTREDNYWGFQFLWNPQTVQNVLTRNSNVVPSVLDAHAELNGLFTAMEGLQFTITIDRVNDFACAKSLYSSTKDNSSRFDKYYVKGGNPGYLQDFPTQFKELMTMGTMADIEYIYRMINGSGQRGGRWVNGLGRKTADLGFLSPTAVGLRFGPGPESLSYVGWIESLNVSHTMFTQDMIPIHSEVSVSFNAFSRVSLTGIPPALTSHRTAGGK